MLFWLDAVSYSKCIWHCTIHGHGLCCACAGTGRCSKRSEERRSEMRVNACSRIISVASSRNIVTEGFDRGKALTKFVLFCPFIRKLTFVSLQMLPIIFISSQRHKPGIAHDKLSLTDSHKRSFYHERVMSIRILKTCWAFLQSSVFKIRQKVG